MCNLDKGFKLCSCTKDLQEDQIDWILMRKDKNLPLLHKKGIASIPLFSKEENELKTAIVKLLNQENCFDFPFEAKEDDFLKLRINKTNNSWAAFRFSTKKWQKDSSTRLSGWRSQLKKWGQGKIK